MDRTRTSATARPNVEMGRRREALSLALNNSHAVPDPVAGIEDHLVAGLKPFAYLDRQAVALANHNRADACPSLLRDKSRPRVALPEQGTKRQPEHFAFEQDHSHVDAVAVSE